MNMRYKWQERLRRLERAAEADKVKLRKALLPDWLLEEAQRQNLLTLPAVKTHPDLRTRE